MQTATSLDIDERKTAEEQLRRYTQELQRSQFYLAEGRRLAHMGSWAFDPDGFYYWSPELFRIHGLDPASKPPSVQEYLDRVHPHDRESMADLIKGILVKASPFDAIKRIVRPSGEVRYIRCVGAPVVVNGVANVLFQALVFRYGARAPDPGTPPARSVPDGSPKAQSHRQLSLET
jgi:PAS domain-containing protein